MFVKFWICLFILGGKVSAFSPWHFDTDESVEELVIPRRIQENGESSIHLRPQDEDEIRYKIEGRLDTYVLRVIKNNLGETLNGGFIVRTLEGHQNKTLYHNRKDCHYYGEIIGVRQSWISVDLCDGLNGIIVYGNQTIYITPVEVIQQVGFVHRLKYDKYNKTKIRFYDSTNHTKGHRNIAKVQNHSNVYRTKRNAGQVEKIVEVYLVLDSALFVNYLRGETNLAIKYTEPVIQHLDTLFRSVSIRTVLIGIETWNNTDPVTSSTDATELLNDFLDYSANKIVPYMKPPDLVALITGRTFASMVVGMAFVDVICGRLSGTVVQHDNDPWILAITLAHEIGHTLGLIHDDPKCSCVNGPSNCIMNAVVSASTTQFSSCSKDNLQKYFSKGGGTCLYDKPDIVYNGPICGNGIKEKGELCDCGDAKSCAKSACCLPGCKLKTGMECSSGECCLNCKLKRKCTLCRSTQNECDLEEYCDGISEECPPNTFKRDLIGCGTNTAEGYCYHGRCRSNTGQCEYIWGTGTKDVTADPAFNNNTLTQRSTPSHPACFQDNSGGTISGNCGSKAAYSYIKCNSSDVMCGTIFCDSNNTYPVIPGQQSIIITTSNIGKSIKCRAAQIKLGEDVPDPGLVDNGSPCLQGRSKVKGVCLDRKCIKLADIKLKSCPLGINGSECSGNGICNNKGECFCNLNFTGNDCSKQTFPCEETPKDKPKSTDDLEPWKIAVISVSGILFIVLIIVGLIFVFKKNRTRDENRNSIEDGPIGVKQKPPKTAWNQKPKSGSIRANGQKRTPKKSWTKISTIGANK